MTTFARLRRDPLKGKKEFSRHHGFTVIELMIVVAVLAIITSLAFPSYRALIEKRQVTSGAQQISAFLSAAKMEAVKRNDMIAVYTDVDNACAGFFVYDPQSPRTDCDCSLNDPEADNACAIDEFGGGGLRLHILNESVLNKPVKIAAIDVVGREDGLLVFDPIRGMLVFDKDAKRFPLELKMLSKQDTYGLNVRVSATGRVTICSDTSEAELAVPGYDPCNNPGI